MTASETRRLATGLGLSAVLALTARLSSGLGSLAGWPGITGDRGLALSISATVLWLGITAWIIWRFRWRGAVALAGAPLALALPVFYLAAGPVAYACAALGEHYCP